MQTDESVLRQEYAARRLVWSDIVDHLPTLYETAAAYPSAVVLELGVRSGNSTAALLAAVEHAGGHLWSVDISQPSVPNWWSQSGLWTLTVGDDVDPVVAGRQPSVLDVLFVDTSHTYEHTLAELRLYVPRVRPGGTVLMHDTDLDGSGVRGALDEFCAEAGLRWSNVEGSCGLGVIRIAGTSV